MTTSQKAHWENIYKTKDHKKVGWYQEHPTISLDLFSKIHAESSQSVVDVGCGTSSLVDNLIEQGFDDITLVELSEEALSAVEHRLGNKGNLPCYLSEDITKVSFNRTFDIWHDRAVFHFLTDADDRKAYMETLVKSLAVNGRAIVGTFSLNGPKTCSGLDIVQYDHEKMRSELSHEFEIEDSVMSTHIKPDESEQEFMYFIIKRSQTQDI